MNGNECVMLQATYLHNNAKLLGVAEDWVAIAPPTLWFYSKTSEIFLHIFG